MDHGSKKQQQSPTIDVSTRPLPLAVDEQGQERPYVPVEWFKATEYPQIWQPQMEVARTFLSSGTSGQRSRSLFSYDGLAIYREQAIASFREVLGRVLPAGVQPEAVEGISLIPASNEWPDSSLAQMLTWFAEVWPVRFWTVDDLIRGSAGLKAQPRWLFGTAAHWLDVLRRAPHLPLDGDKFVFETGGLKSLDASLDRGIFYDDLGRCLAISPTQIISEYGMSEAAAQAYDWVDAGVQFSLTHRRYRFLDARALVMRRPEKLAKQGIGALVIENPGRLDLLGPIRTQDIVRLDADGGFELLGRIPQAELRGCSLRVEQVVRPSDATAISPAPLQQSMTINPTAVGARLVGLTERLQQFWCSSEFIDALTKEIGSTAAAKWALADLCVSLPADETAWQAAVTQATQNAAIGKRWLLIPPTTHSIAAMQPLVLGAVVGLAMTVRLPARADDAVLQTIEFLRSQLQASIDVLPSSWRLAANNSGAWDGILCFGTDDTIAKLRQIAAVPVKGFGSHLTISIVTDLSDATARMLVKDAFSLGQRGCMCSRLALVSGPTATPQAMTAFYNELTRAFAEFWSEPLSETMKLALDHESLRWRSQGGVVLPRLIASDQALFPQLQQAEAPPLASSLQAFLSERALVLPIVWLSTKTSLDLLHMLDDTMKAHSELQLLTASQDFLEQNAKLLNEKQLMSHFRPLGLANVPIWTGLHQGQALFAGG